MPLTRGDGTIGMARQSGIQQKLLIRSSVLPHLREIALLAGAYFAYMFVRWVIVPGADTIGLEHAVSVVAFEKVAGFFWEPHLQEAAAGAGKWVLIAFNYVYIFTYFPIILTAAVIYYIKDRQRYLYYRNIVLLSFAVALVIFAAFPLAPPRFAAVASVLDTISLHGPLWYASREATAYYNAYAAMPSLHFAWTFLFGFLFWNSGPKILKVLAVLYPTSAFLSITVTGNHYIVDAIGGALMMLVVYLFYESGMRRGHLARLLPARSIRRLHPPQ